MARAIMVFAMTVFIGVMLLFQPSAFLQQLSGSMRWFEIEDNGICRPSPVNRLVRPQVCLGFELGIRLVASR